METTANLLQHSEDNNGLRQCFVRFVEYRKSMKVLLSALLCLIPISSVAQDYMHLTVTKITRERKATEDCNKCGRVTTIEANTATSSFVLVCEAHIHPRDMKHNTICADVKTRTYEVRMIGADEISFWPDNSPGAPGEYRLNFSVVIEETHR